MPKWVDDTEEIIYIYLVNETTTTNKEVQTMKNIKNTKNNLTTIDSLTTVFIMSLKLNANNILTIRDGAREILKCAYNHNAEDRDFRNFMADMVYVSSKFFGMTITDLRNYGIENWQKLHKMFVAHFESMDM